MKKFLFFLSLTFAFGTLTQNLFAQEKKLFGMDLGFQITNLGEVGFFFAYQTFHFYMGVGMNIWQPNDFEGDPYWNDVTMRLGYNRKFKIGIGILGGLQVRWLNVRSNWGGSVSSSTSGGYSGSSEIGMHFIFMPEIGVSYTWKRVYGNIAYQFDTNNIKNSTACFVIGGTL
ncbi:MAG: hypothetical protein LBC53_04825 [Spirochaetaceae bacterium]|nr:hypothetical protein [Spirochaetaceae bacterium]